MNCVANMFVSTILLLSIINFNSAFQSMERRGANSHYVPKYYETTASHWNDIGQQTVLQNIMKKENTNIAKNIIFYLGDGMSLTTITSSRIYNGQTHGFNGEETNLEFDLFPYVGLQKTYCVNKQTTDSAASATAYLTGVKGNFYTVGVTAAVQLNDTTTSLNVTNQVDSILKWAQEAGKSTGLISTARVTHASPGALYAHTCNRDWECDGDYTIPNIPSNFQDIAAQLMYNDPGNKINVILGGGRSKFLPNTTMEGNDGQYGGRMDGVNLIDYWQNEKGASGQYVSDKEGLDNVDYENTDYLLGLFTPLFMDWWMDADPNVQPSLSDMTTAAIKILEKNPNGYFLFVEGGLIDIAHHFVMAQIALNETTELANAVKVGVNMTNENDTLIVVTADHSHTITLAGYSDRGVNILGLNSMDADLDDLPYPTLSYANSPIYQMVGNGSVRNNYTETGFNPHNDVNYQYPGSYPVDTETHGGDDIPVYARGPWAHLFTGVYENSAIPHLMAYASCVGAGKLHACDQSNESSSSSQSEETYMEYLEDPSSI